MYCAYCAVKLELHVRATEDKRTVDVTSNHLEIIPIQNENSGDDGPELLKRANRFGEPIGKCTFLCVFTAANQMLTSLFI